MVAPGEFAIEVEGLLFGYGSQPLLSIPEFRLQRGESKAVLGPSGCGKSTFVHLLAGLAEPTHGSIRILGTSIGALKEEERDRFRGRHIGLVFQRFHLLPALNVRQNVALALRLGSRSRADERLEEILNRLGLESLAQKCPAALSQGQEQRVAIARALVHRPDLLIADEPTSALDDTRALEALSLLKDCAAASGAALLVVTHDLRLRGQFDDEFLMQAPQ
ncbi:MAG: ABC transporter ATP-binding protein [Congregibacter sp.]